VSQNIALFRHVLIYFNPCFHFLQTLPESDSTVLLRNNPVELKQTFSSDTQDYHQADTTNARNGVSWMQIDLNWSKSLEKEGNDDLFLASRQYFESQLESTQVSPIRLRGDSVELTHCSSLDYAADETQSTQTANFSSYKRDVNSSRMKNETLLIEKSLSSSSSSSPSGKPRKIRPMPDMSAFDGYSSSITKQADVRHSTSFSSLSTFVCPPTPMLKVARRLSQSLQSNKLLVDCNHNSIEGAGRAKDGKKLDTQVTMNPIFDVPQSSSAEDEFDADIANANFGYIEDKKNVAELNDHGISFNKDFINLGVLGSGAFADVFKVRCKTDGMLYAVKRRRRQLCSIRDRERALKEVRIMHHLQYNDTFHDRCLYILKLFKAWQEDGYFFCQTELCCRDNCQQLIHSLRIDWQVLCRRFPNLSRHFALHQDDFDRPRSTIIPESAIWKICHDVSAGLSHIHSCGIIHCDIKPCNIFFHYSDSEGCICRIGDFGLADISGSEEDGQEGDTAFMALELLSSNKKDASADIFSLGMTIYKLSTDSNWEPPSEGIRWREVRGELHDPELPSSRSRSLKNLVKCTISPNAKARPSANFILSNIDEVKSAGNSRNAFLEDYVRDVNQFESLCERQLAAAQKAALEL
jgi:serine/threonine protein kinase